MAGEYAGGRGGEGLCMIYGMGIDSADIDRVARSMQSARFAARVYSPDELTLMEGRGEKRRAEIAAGCFAAKEAFLKACGRGLGGFPLGEIAALRRESGAPYYRLGGSAAAWCAENGLAAHLSITHEAGVATAVAVLEKG